MKKEILATYTCEIPEPTDEEIIDYCRKNRLMVNISPEDIRKRFRERIYKTIKDMVDGNLEEKTQENIITGEFIW